MTHRWPRPAGAERRYAQQPFDAAVLLRRWLTERAREVLTPALEECARELGFGFERRPDSPPAHPLGSCSTRGTISLNCCLLFQRPPVVRYLLIHELVHTRHMNHSRRFWQLCRAVIARVSRVSTANCWMAGGVCHRGCFGDARP